MKTKIVYILISRESDYYAEMLLLSLSSLRIYHPKDEVLIVMDNSTHDILIKRRSPLLALAESIVVDVPTVYSTTQISRYLKTKLRKIVSGDFLYLDTDTVICSRLDECDLFKNSIYAVLDNHHGAPLEYQLNSYPNDWKYLEGSRQFNGGVIYSKDNAESKLFFDLWFDNWDYSTSLGCHFDQPALRKVVLESGIGVTELDGSWNCQVLRPSSSDYQLRAKIMHYQRSAFFVSYICRRIRHSGLEGKDIEYVLFHPREAFKTQMLNITNAEYATLEPLWYTLHNYPVFFRFCSRLAQLFRHATTFLINVKHRLQ